MISDRRRIRPRSVWRAGAFVTTVTFGSIAGAAPVIVGQATYSEGSTTDPFDLSQGTVVDGSTPTIFPAGDTLGGTGGGESTHTIFSDSAPANNVDFINFHTTGPITIAGYQALLQDDGTTSNRAATSFKLFESADNTYTSLTLLSSATISSPYTSAYPTSATTSEIAVTDNAATGFVATTGQFWRLEVVRVANGPRVVEVDAISVPEPVSLSLLGIGSLGLLARRRRA